MGPTASGKTALAVELVKRHPFQIISVDSAQVYKGMDIGTGKLDSEALKAFPHRLIDIRDPAEPYSAADFRNDALQQIDEVLDQGDVPLLVGGTMLYFRVLRDGLADMPHADTTIREEIVQLAKREGWDKVHQDLAKVDPQSASRIHPNDPQRLQRALEVYLVSGKTMAELHSMQADNSIQDPLSFNLHYFAIQPEDRQQLHGRIEKRFKQMLEAGLVSEVETLYRRGDLSQFLPSIKSVGYRQVWRHLSGELGYDEMVEKGTIATRQLAKRQLTWLRSWGQLQRLRGSPVKSIDCVLNYVDSASI
jgi:tRNA dimethylallyltransferase